MANGAAAKARKLIAKGIAAIHRQKDAWDSDFAAKEAAADAAAAEEAERMDMIDTFEGLMGPRTSRPTSPTLDIDMVLDKLGDSPKAAEAVVDDNDQKVASTPSE
jgi:hypothetical protein